VTADPADPNLNGVGPRYRALCRAAELEGDPDQNLAAARLQDLHEALAARPRRRWWNLQRNKPSQILRGIYLHGAVGRGKSMLMDLFFHDAPVSEKRRVHFHAFMQEVHAELYHFRQSQTERADPIPPLARRLEAKAMLLCFDEFQVSDVADAMILGRLWQALLDRGVVIVATSNTAPDALYQGGINRQLFLPFIEMVKSRMDVLHLGGARDYRLLRLAGLPVWHSPLGAPASAALELAFAALTDGADARPITLEIQGRQLIVAAHARGVARFSFDDLCARALGPADYLEIARRFHALVLSDVPVLGPELRNEAKRFATLVDTLYEAKTKLIASAAAPPEALFTGGDVAYARTVSRLREMQSADYRALPHVAGGD
jgi:cell division protein ZapE